LELKQQYLEIVAFLTNCGGIYQLLDTATCMNVIDGLTHGRVLLSRDKLGRLQRVLIYWRVRPEDLELVKSGGKPKDVASGSLLYIAECAGVDGRPGLVRTIKALRESQAGFEGVCWHSRCNRPELFRLFPGRQAEGDL
jgi:hypothetical protein